MFTLELVKFLAVIGPGRQREANRRIDRGHGLRRALARGCCRFDPWREPRENAAEIGAALAPRSLAVEIVALEQDALPLLVDEAHESVRDCLGIGPHAVAAHGNSPLAEVYNHPAPGRVAVAADALVVGARIGLGQKCIPDRDLVRIAEAAAEARVDDAEERAEIIVARLFEHGRHDFSEFLRHFAKRREQERFLTAEMEINRGRRVSGGARDFRGSEF